ncbi:nuclear transport factor 2 family protein [Rhodococcus chondri]|uniref:Nuclear transport factor 2 family protein n=1 Tax=Rhodococcus chondri TaxID=3065941 RepID=A0ABU7JS89_9NOCA|nr:nuclear transport factor 2 family protein [Rhodococcus sp. CC-R104]MEE2032901.1 nuclear transport factor 2 family protein [Rhodococcus sp. CC-R104]
MTLQELQDKAEIADLIYRYATAVDTKDWDRMASVFTEDAHLDYSSVGYPPGSRDEVLAILRRALEQVPMTQHFVTNIEIRLDGDRALVRAMFYNPMRLPGATELTYCGGNYHHEMVRTSDGWKSCRLTEESLWFSNHPDPAKN